MLSEQVRRLLTASVDGELSTRQRRQLERLLRHSREARALLSQFQQDSHTLRHFTRQAAPPDLADSVVRAIADMLPTPSATLPFRPVSRLPVFLSIATAATVLLCIGYGSFLFFSGPSS